MWTKTQTAASRIAPPLDPHGPANNSRKKPPSNRGETGPCAESAPLSRAANGVGALCCAGNFFWRKISYQTSRRSPRTAEPTFSHSHHRSHLRRPLTPPCASSRRGRVDCRAGDHRPVSAPLAGSSQTTSNAPQASCLVSPANESRAASLILDLESPQCTVPASRSPYCYAAADANKSLLIPLDTRPAWRCNDDDCTACHRRFPGPS